jgi:hypothetical protein
MSVANEKTLGGALLATFSLHWVMNWEALTEASQCGAVGPSVVLAVDVTCVVVFIAFSHAFGFDSRLLVVFLLDVVLLYLPRIARHLASPGGVPFCPVS